MPYQNSPEREMLTDEKTEIKIQNSQSTAKVIYDEIDKLFEQENCQIQVTAKDMDKSDGDANVHI